MRSKTELAEWVEAKIDELRKSNPNLIQDRGQSVMVFGTIGSQGCITRQGDIYLEEDTFDPEPWTFVRRTDRIAQIRVLVLAATRYPELGGWIPERGADSKSCGRCGGSGEWTFGHQSLLCEVCGGIGWVPAEEGAA